MRREGSRVCRGPHLHHPAVPKGQRPPPPTATALTGFSPRLENRNRNGLRPLRTTAQKKYPWALCPPEVPGGGLAPAPLSFPSPSWSVSSATCFQYSPSPVPSPASSFFSFFWPLLNQPRFPWNKRNLTDAKNHCGRCQMYLHSLTQKSKCLAWMVKLSS